MTKKKAKKTQKTEKDSKTIAEVLMGACNRLDPEDHAAFRELLGSVCTMCGDELDGFWEFKDGSRIYPYFRLETKKENNQP